MANVVDFNAAPVINESHGAGGLFDQYPKAAFWIGRVSTEGSIHQPEEFDNLTRFRRQVYVDELEFLGREHVDPLGREIDEDDARSTNFVVFSQGSAENLQVEDSKVVGSARIIVKTEEDKPLPIESYFPELFEDQPLSKMTGEVSRFIARDANRERQHRISLALMRAIAYHSVNNQLGEGYCMIEQPLLRLLKVTGIPIDVLGEPKEITEYNGILIPVKLEAGRLIGTAKSSKAGSFLLRRFFQDDSSNQGLGYFPDSLMGGQA